MIILTLAGLSSRFFDSGYKEVKYKLPLNGKTVIENILDYIEESEKIIIVLNKKYKHKEYFENLLYRRFGKYRIVEIVDSRGQLETVYKALLETRDFWNKSDRLIVFNGDTVRKLNYQYSEYNGAIECFIKDGDHWSFVDRVGFVSKVTEKQRISKYCSTGFYEFESPFLIIDNFANYVTQGELYVAPFYNHLISQGMKIVSFLSNEKDFIMCGTPAEYENAIINTKS